MTIDIAIDAMGGDHGLAVTIPAALLALQRHPELVIWLTGDETTLQSALVDCSATLRKRIHIVHASQVISMDEQPALALRGKKDSSMRIAINLVRDQKVQACVSAGNTGALMAIARFVLKTLAGIDRPAIITTFPTRLPGKGVRMLDLGANVDSSPESLLQFAYMGSIVSEAVDHIARPRVGLLNIGVEQIKGNELVKKTSELISACPDINYIGYVEGDYIFSGEVDVVVTDGFIGNIALKTSEGSANLLLHYLRQAFRKNWYAKIIGYLAKPMLKNVLAQIDPSNYNGANFIGLQGTVVKSHGGADVMAFANAITQAMLLAQQNVPERIKHTLTLKFEGDVSL